ncbi:MAG TPA: EthD family reductase [Candidatus Dormibacteraeota bacterium]|nr:EthD family reductase [Candidatus Dormibacteraeota bacterium]
MSARFLVLWDAPRDPVEFDRHYREVHIPLAKKMPGLRRYTLSRNVVPIRGGEPLHAIGELDFDDMASLQRAFGSPEGRATAADVANLAAGATVRSMTYELEEL